MARRWGRRARPQHPKCEAIDFDVKGQPLDDTFAKLLDAARAGKFRFGQLILEEADRGYKDENGAESIARWVHCSVISSLNPEHIGQVMKAAWNAAEKKFNYSLVDKLDFKGAA